MSGRGLDPSQISAVALPHRAILPLVEMYFDSGTLLLALGPADIITPTGTYIHAGPLMYVREPTEEVGSSEGLEVGMTGLDPDAITIATSEPYIGRIIKLLKAYINPVNGDVIGLPRVWYIGRMRSMQITEDNTSASIAILSEHYDIELSRASPIRYNDADQQRLHPGDRGCEYAARTANEQIIWPSKQAQGG